MSAIVQQATPGVQRIRSASQGIAGRVTLGGVLPAEAATVTRRYLELADELIPGAVEGFYVIGSAALDDYVPGASDVDFVAVSQEPLTGALVELRQLHDALRAAQAEPSLDGIYVTREELARPPEESGPVPLHREGATRLDQDPLTPVTWHSLVQHGVACRGPRPSELTVHADPDELRAWCLDNLDGYWTKWLSRARSSATRTAMTMLTDWGVAWGVLGVARLHYTIATGEITSKSGGGRYALRTFEPAWQPIVGEALALRGRPLTPPDDPAAARERRRVALQFMAATIADAHRLP